MFHVVTNDEKCEFSILDVVVRTAEFLIAFIGCLVLLLTYRKYTMLRQEEEIMDTIGELKKKGKKKKRNFVKEKFFGARLSNLDASGLDYMLDVDEEGNVVGGDKKYKELSGKGDG